MIADNLFLFKDTCNVYILRSGKNAVLIDFGSGDVLDQLESFGIERVSAILMTHHHRDNAQGLAKAAAFNIPIYVPHAEAALFDSVDLHWQARAVDNNYNVRQDRFSLLDPIPVSGTLEDYTVYRFGGLSFEVLPTPGHTPGAVTFLVELDGKRLAFTGDLIAAPGKVWSMAATQWTYNGLEGVAAGVLSLLDLVERQPDMILPAHGTPMPEPKAAVEPLVERFTQLLRLRQMHLDLLDIREHPYTPVTPHLLRHRQSVANSFVLLSERGTALMFDFGYDMDTGLPSGTDRAARRPWLYSLSALKRDYHVQRIDVVLPTHYHDDHVAGVNVLRRVEGTQVWAAEFFTDLLENPQRYDLPCLWYEPIPVDCRLPLETPFQWEEYTLTLYALPGHTRYAVAILLEVDGKRVLVSGDQYQGPNGLDPNYVYANRFAPDDFTRSGALYRRLAPDVILTGHWLPLWTTPTYFDQLDDIGAQVERLHTELLVEGGCYDDSLARILPYQADVDPGCPFDIQIEVTNPYPRTVDADLTLVLPPGWRYIPVASDDRLTVALPPFATRTVTITLIVPLHFDTRRARVAVDVTLDDTRLGQQAHALISARCLPK